MNTTPRLTFKAAAELEAHFANQDEALTLIDLIAAEFESDPSSVACFDLRIVERVKKCAAFERKRDKGLI